MSSFDHSTPIEQIGQQMTSLRKARPEAMQGFGQLAKAAMALGVLDEKQKELIALAIGVTQHCSGCIGFHVKALRRLCCTRSGLEDRLAVCVYMGGGPALTYTSEALAAWDAFEPVTA
jgi:AhpD family alkylhydroperoxidase